MSGRDEKEGGLPPELSPEGGLPPELSSEGGLPPELSSEGGLPPKLSPEGGRPPEKKQALGEDAAAASTSKEASPISSLKLRSQAKAPISPRRFMETKKSSLSTLQQSSGSTGVSLSSLEDEEGREIITIRRIRIVEEEVVKYLYALEGDTDLDTYWSDEEGYVAQLHEDGTPKRRQTFTYPIFNEKSYEIYNEFIKKDSKYSMVLFSDRRIKAEMYDKNTNECINLRMFKEIAKTLDTPPKIIEGDEECKVIVCGLIEDSKEAFLNFDVNTAELVRYLVRLASKLNPNLTPVELKNIDPVEMYAVVDPSYNAYTRLVLPENYEEKTKSYRDEREEVRKAEVEREKRIVPSEDERLRRVELRKKAAEKDSETVVFLLVDIGLELPLHKSVVYKLSDVCEELKDIPYQATKVLVKSVNNNRNFPEGKLEDFFIAGNILTAKRYRGESDGNQIWVDLFES